MHPVTVLLNVFRAAVSVLIGPCCPALLESYSRKCAHCCIIGQIKWWREREKFIYHVRTQQIHTQWWWWYVWSICRCSRCWLPVSWSRVVRRSDVSTSWTNVDRSRPTCCKYSETVWPNLYCRNRPIYHRHNHAMGPVGRVPSNLGDHRDRVYLPPPHFCNWLSFFAGQCEKLKVLLVFSRSSW